MKFTWHDLTVGVGEMGRVAMLDCEKEFNAFLIEHDGKPDQLTLDMEIGWLLVKYSSFVFIEAGKPLEAGSHIIKVDDVPYRLTLPMTRAVFDELPYSLILKWADAAGKENAYLSAAFFVRRSYLLSLLTTSVPLSDSGQSSAPNVVTVSEQTKTTGA